MEKGTCCRAEKKTERSAEEKKKLLDRLARIEGQIRGIRGMVERDAYCSDVLVQSAAATAALDAFACDLLARHIETCVARDLMAGKTEAAGELAETVRKLLK